MKNVKAIKNIPANSFIFVFTILFWSRKVSTTTKKFVYKSKCIHPIYFYLFIEINYSFICKIIVKLVRKSFFMFKSIKKKTNAMN